ncbi:MAG: hypothetical protein U0W40_00355 [Acidimicrobiia bacterium]
MDDDLGVTSRREALLPQPRAPRSRSQQAVQATGHALLAVDNVRARFRPTRKEHPLPAPVASVLVTVSHWRSETAAADRNVDHRNQLLSECIAGCLEIDASCVSIIVYSNDPRGAAAVLSDRLNRSVDVVDHRDAARPPTVSRRVATIGWKPGPLLRHGFHMAWAHKRLYRDALRNAGWSHFVNLEDDLRFDHTSFEYWIEARKLLHKFGVLPAHVRFERHEGRDFALDATAQQRYELIASFGPDTWFGEAVTFSPLDQPHQALYVMDRGLAVEHFRFSPARSGTRSAAVRPWGWLERSAMGPNFDDPIPGRLSRSVVPVIESGTTRRLDRRCLVEHMSCTYAPMPGSPHGKLPLDAMFADAS